MRLVCLLMLVASFSDAAEPCPLGQKFQEQPYPGTPLLRERGCVGKDAAGRYVPQGKWEAFHKNGKKKSDTSYRDGKLDGVSVSWDETGRKASEVLYKNGVQVVVPPPVGTEDFDPTALAKFVRERKAEIKECYERELQSKQTLQGTIVVGFTITSAGKAKEVEISEDGLRDEAVARCLVALVQAWTFPFRPPDDVPVAYPFVFSPEQ